MMHTRTSFAFLFVPLMLIACTHTPATAPQNTSMSAATVAGGIGESAARIDVARADAEAKAPEVAPESALIGIETDRLRQYQADLAVAVKQIQASEKAAKELADDNADLRKQIDAIKTSGIRRVLIGLAAAAVVGAALSIWLLRSMQLAAACGTVLACSIGGMYLLAYAMWIAIGLAVLIVGVAAWSVWRLAKANKEVVLTAERFKHAAPADKEGMEAVAERLQSPFTRRLVDKVRQEAKAKAKELDRARRALADFGGAA